jgi:hypothetical protein
MSAAQKQKAANEEASNPFPLFHDVVHARTFRKTRELFYSVSRLDWCRYALAAFDYLRQAMASPDYDKRTEEICYYTYWLFATFLAVDEFEREGGDLSVLWQHADESIMFCPRVLMELTIISDLYTDYKDRLVLPDINLMMGKGGPTAKCPNRAEGE